MGKRKGQTSNAIIIIIIIAVVIVAYFVLTNPDILSGFNLDFGRGGETVKPYSNDIITLTGKTISNKNPLAGSTTTIEFYVNNNGDKIVEYAEVFFTDLPGLSDFKIMQCEGGRKEKMNDVERKCIFDKGSSECKEADNDCRLSSFDARKVRVVLTTDQSIKTTRPITIRYQVSYLYGGKRTIRIPIVNDIAQLPKEVKFDPGKQTYGPIQVDVEPPVGREREELKQRIVENFAYQDTPFSITFNFKNIGSSSLGTIEPVILAGNSLTVSLENLQMVLCDKLETATGSTTLILKEGNVNGGWKIPFSVSCSLQSAVTESTRAYEIGNMTLDFKYNYKFMNSEELTITPMETATIAATDCRDCGNN